MILGQAGQHVLHIIECSSALPVLNNYVGNRHQFQHIQEGKAHPLKPALSSKNLLKSAMSLSIASRMCMCRTSVHTVSVSERTAVLSSYAPIEDWNLYLHNRQKVMTTIRERKSSSWNGTQRVFRPIVDRKQVVRHRLVRKLVNERRNGVHRAVSDDQRRTLPPRILFLKKKKKRTPPVALKRGEAQKQKHARTGKSGFARLYSSNAACTSNASTRDNTSASAASCFRACSPRAKFVRQRNEFSGCGRAPAAAFAVAAAGRVLSCGWSAPRGPWSAGA